MSERAYSLELKKDISAKQASDFSIKGRLHDRQNFQCIDPDCRINMTCTNWNKKGGVTFLHHHLKTNLMSLDVINCLKMKLKNKKSAKVLLPKILFEKTD